MAGELEQISSVTGLEQDKPWTVPQFITGPQTFTLIFVSLVNFKCQVNLILNTVNRGKTLHIMQTYSRRKDKAQQNVIDISTDYNPVKTNPTGKVTFTEQ